MNNTTKEQQDFWTTWTDYVEYAESRKEEVSQKGFRIYLGRLATGKLDTSPTDDMATKEQQCHHRYGSKDDPLICGECGQHVATPSGRVEIVEFLNKRPSTVAVTDDMAIKEEWEQSLSTMLGHKHNHATVDRTIAKIRTVILKEVNKAVQEKEAHYQSDDKQVVREDDVVFYQRVSKYGHGQQCFSIPSEIRELVEHGALYRVTIKKVKAKQLLATPQEVQNADI